MLSDAEQHAPDDVERRLTPGDVDVLAPLERGGPASLPGRFVVGVDGSLGVLTAVSWAASEAAATGAALHLVHAAPAADALQVRPWLRRALGAALAVAPDVAVSVARVDGRPDRALAELGEAADRLVVGGRRRRDAPGPAGDRAVVRLLVAARCPVVVVPPCRTGAWASTPSRRPVLVALRGTDGDAATLELAAGSR